MRGFSMMIEKKKRDARKAARQLEEVNWKTVGDIIRDRVELAQEAAQVGVYAYCGGGVNGTLLGDALSMQLETPEQAANVVNAIVEGKTFTSEQLDEIIRRVFFRMGIYRAFLARSSGQLKRKQGAANEKE